MTPSGQMVYTFLALSSWFDEYTTAWRLFTNAIDADGNIYVGALDGRRAPLGDPISSGSPGAPHCALNP